MTGYPHDIDPQTPRATEDTPAAPEDPGAGAANAGDTTANRFALQEDPDQVLAERDDYRDRLLRSIAEFDNYRKRIDRERRELAEFASSELLQELLPLVDDLERALAATPATDSPAVASYRAGVELIHRQLMDLLRKRGVTAIDALGTDFDPHWHQAVASDVSSSHREGEVIEELRRGYKLGERLLRPAMVKVASRE